MYLDRYILIFYLSKSTLKKIYYYYLVLNTRASLQPHRKRSWLEDISLFYIEGLEVLTSLWVSTFLFFYNFASITHELPIFKPIIFLCYYIHFSLLVYNVRFSQLRLIKSKVHISFFYYYYYYSMLPKTCKHPIPTFT